MQLCKRILIQTQSPSTSPTQGIDTLPSHGTEPKNEAVDHHPSVASPHSSDTLTLLFSLGGPPFPHTHAQPGQNTSIDIPRTPPSNPATMQPSTSPFLPPDLGHHTLGKAAQASLPPSSMPHQQRRLHSRHLLQQGNLRPLLQQCISRNNSHSMIFSFLLCMRHFVYKSMNIFLDRYYHIFKPNQFPILLPP